MIPTIAGVERRRRAAVGRSYRREIRRCVAVNAVRVSKLLKTADRAAPNASSPGTQRLFFSLSILLSPYPALFASAGDETVTVCTHTHTHTRAYTDTGFEWLSQTVLPTSALRYDVAATARYSSLLAMRPNYRVFAAGGAGDSVFLLPVLFRCFLFPLRCSYVVVGVACVRPFAFVDTF